MGPIQGTPRMAGTAAEVTPGHTKNGTISGEQMEKSQTMVICREYMEIFPENLYQNMARNMVQYSTSILGS